jgi:Tol biopolymer transport system component
MGESAAWSPDGRRLAYFAADDADRNELPGGPRIYVIGADGSGARRIFMNDLVSTYPEYFYGPFPTYVRDGKAFGPLVWSPDGRWLAFARQFEEGASVWRLEVETGELEALTAPGPDF